MTPHPPNPLALEEIQPAKDVTAKLLHYLDQNILGQQELHRMVVVALLSRGHVLLEGVPGVGKTALVRGLAQLIGVAYNRIQCTPDLMPGDILGQHILQENERGERDMVFREGPVFTNLLLADEINRATPKTQSALLEAMQDNAVTLLGTTRQLPQPFFVLATQNPIEHEGTYPLPEAQLDRFLFKLQVSHVNPEILEAIIATRRRGNPPLLDWHLEPAAMESLFTVMDRIFLASPVAGYIARLVSATHPTAPEATATIKTYVTLGASPRAAIGIAESARAHALIDGRPTVGFEDVKAVAVPTLNHRLIVNYQARMDGIGPARVIRELLDQLNETGLHLPGDITLK